MAPVIVLFGLALVVVFFIFYKAPVKKVTLPGNYKDILLNHVSYYQRLTKKSRLRFEEKIKDFLSYVRIDGVDTAAEDLDILLVACSAVIPVFGFKNWKYHN